MVRFFQKQVSQQVHLPFWFGWWLVLLFVLVLAIMLIGATTRLTDSGLSMVEWRPLMGGIPPLSQSEWVRIFSLYQETLEYRSYPIDISSFKVIFWWEYIHRTWGRLIGFVAIVPFVWLLWRRVLNAWWVRHLLAVISLGALQGGVGYWMVLSGLRYRMDVAPERLAVHFFMAISILIYLSFLIRKTWFPYLPRRGHVKLRVRLWVWLTNFWVVILAFSGVLVAGLDGGYVYNSFPLMGDSLISKEYGLFATDAWSLIFDDPVTAQVHHRLLAYGSFFVVGVQTYWLRRCGCPRVSLLSKMLLLLLVLQGLLGVATLLSVVWLPFALLHQLGGVGLLLLSFFVWFDTHCFEDVAGKVERTTDKQYAGLFLRD